MAHYLLLWAPGGVTVQSRELQLSMEHGLAPACCSPTKGVRSLFSWEATFFLSLTWTYKVTAHGQERVVAAHITSKSDQETVFFSRSPCCLPVGAHHMLCTWHMDTLGRQGQLPSIEKNPQTGLKEETSFGGKPRSVVSLFLAVAQPISILLTQTKG